MDVCPFRTFYSNVIAHQERTPKEGEMSRIVSFLVFGLALVGLRIALWAHEQDPSPLDPFVLGLGLLSIFTILYVAYHDLTGPHRGKPAYGDMAGARFLGRYEDLYGNYDLWAFGDVLVARYGPRIGDCIQDRIDQAVLAPLVEARNRLYDG